ncbi:GGDEF domain-containing protein [Fundidesulfovibrio soli]|uniref:GGDEF domain-containing protein n=1 Tax=Fundidesulfovibrio soli TaxID=2922716 RepID=UPI001FAEA4AB|nr:GGDEF domain-containing protein [Fundidesulfovibrio soli]
MVNEASVWCFSTFNVVVGLGLLVLQAALLVWLLLDRNRRMRAEKRLLETSVELEHALLERSRDLQQAMTDLHDAKASLGQLHRQFDLGTRTDALTGLFNRRHIEERMMEEFSRFQRNGVPFSVILVGMDRLGEIRAQHGQEAAEQLLKKLARESALTVRPYDVVSRWSGEEFLLLLPNTDEGAARIVSDRMGAHLASLEFKHGDTVVQVGVTCGVATVRPEDTLIDVVQNADASLRSPSNPCRDAVNQV